MAAEAVSPPPEVHVRPRWPLRRVVLCAAVLVFAPLALEAYSVMFGGNFHTTVPGKIYRCSQPSTAELERMIADYAIRTVINLRGPCDGFDWYRDQTRVVHDHNICQEDICFSA